MTDPTNSFNSYQHWRDHVRATIYATALANLCTAHLAKGEEVTPAVLEEFEGQAVKLADMWSEGK